MYTGPVWGSWSTSVGNYYSTHFNHDNTFHHMTFFPPTLYYYIWFTTYYTDIFHHRLSFFHDILDTVLRLFSSPSLCQKWHNLTFSSPHTIILWEVFLLNTMLWQFSPHTILWVTYTVAKLLYFHSFYEVTLDNKYKSFYFPLSWPEST